MVVNNGCDGDCNSCECRSECIEVEVEFGVVVGVSSLCMSVSLVSEDCLIPSII